MKKILFVLLSAIFIMSVSGCSKENNADKIPVTVMIPKGTPELALIYLIKNDPVFDGYEVTYKMPNSNDLLASMFMNRDAQIIIAPSNLGAVIYNKGIDYRIRGVLVWGSLYLVGNKELSSFKDLSGKEIVSTGKGLTTDVLLRYLLKADGVEDINIKYVEAVSELAPLFLTGQSEISLMPEPSLSMVLSKKPETAVIMDLQAEWKKAAGLDTGYPQAAVFVDAGFEKDNKDFVEKFMEECKKAAEWVNENPEDAGKYYVEIEPGLDAAVVASSVPGSNIGFVGTKDAKEALIKYYGILLEDDPANIGGGMPDDEFYSQQ
jgi:NitT/TauT family transport system substrate-binding protein